MASSETVYTPTQFTKRLLVMGFHPGKVVYPMELPSGATAESFLSPALFQSTTAEPPTLELMFPGGDDVSTTGRQRYRVRIWLESLRPMLFSPIDEESVERPREDQPCDWLMTGMVDSDQLATPEQVVPVRLYLATRHDCRLHAGYAQFIKQMPTESPLFTYLLADIEEMTEARECDPIEGLRLKPRH